MTSQKVQSPTSSSRLVREHLKASRKLMRKVLKDEASAREFLIKAGLLTKQGKLPRHYRSK